MQVGCTVSATATYKAVLQIYMQQDSAYQHAILQLQLGTLIQLQMLTSSLSCMGHAN